MSARGWREEEGGGEGGRERREWVGRREGGREGGGRRRIEENKREGRGEEGGASLTDEVCCDQY